MSSEIGSKSESRIRVLIVEDDRASRAALAALLRLIGCEPMSASTVAEGLRLLHHKPHCVILDLMLPDGNGSSLLAHIRQHNLPICVVVTTGTTIGSI